MVKPWLLLPASLSHKIAPLYLKYCVGEGPFPEYDWNAFEWKGLQFKNPLGIAGGVDKDAENIFNWWTLGAGFVEVGTITPLSQSGNPGKVIDRDVKNKALWNRMGFPSKGVDYVSNKLSKIPKPHHTPIFVNIGKNRSTPLEHAHEDYISCIKKLSPYSDAFVVNISSPNTPKLRELLTPTHLREFLGKVVEANDQHEGKPLILKISPDVKRPDLENIIDVSIELNLSGWILNNTSTIRPNNIHFPADGGMSGKPIGELSKDTLIHVLNYLGDKRTGKLIISTGGIMSPEDAIERLNLGADLVQVYSSLIFNGLSFFKDVNQYAQSK